MNYKLFSNMYYAVFCLIFFFQAEDGIRDRTVTGVQTCALPICCKAAGDDPGYPETMSAERPPHANGCARRLAQAAKASPLLRKDTKWHFQICASIPSQANFNMSGRRVCALPSSTVQLFYFGLDASCTLVITMSSGLVASSFLPFWSFLVAFFDAMVFLLGSDCPHGRLPPYKQIPGQLSSRTRPEFIPFEMWGLQWGLLFTRQP